MSRRDAYHPLFGCELKLRRVQHHFDALQKAFDGFLGSDPYEIVNERHPEREEYVLWVKVREEPPPEWSPIIGDVVHNCRSALDHLAWQLVIRNKGKPSGSTAFPIFSKSPFDASLYSSAKEAKNALGRWNRQVKGIHDNDVALIKRLQPYNAGKDSEIAVLSMLSDLSNWDKHREYQLTGQTLKGTTYRIRNPRDAQFWISYQRPIGIFEHGTVVARVAFSATGPDPKMDVEVKVSFDIAFGEGSPLKGHGLKEVLITSAQHVTDIVFTFKDRLDRQDFGPPPLQ